MQIRSRKQGNTKEEKVKTIYFSCHKDLLFSDLANRVMDTIKEIWCDRNPQGQCTCEPKINSSLEYRHCTESQKFEALYQSDIIVVLPSLWTLSDYQKTELKIFEILTHHRERLVAVVMPTEQIVRAAFVKGGNGALQKSEMLEDKKEG